ncbi:MAG: hypothetical protein Q9207_003260 [Kuettlingeria erythrocarpa]
MCGILFSYSGDTDHQPSFDDHELLRNRGPDHTGQVHVKHSSRSLSFVSSVLSLRGKSLVTQPLQDPFSGSVLCWNGEAWKLDNKLIQENDARVVFDVLLKTVGSDDSSLLSDGGRDVDEAVAQVFSRVSGPYAFIFYCATNRSVYYGRDFLGRRSLLRSGEAGRVTISSLTYPKHILHPSSVEITRLNLRTPALNPLLENLRHSLAVRITDISIPPSPASVPVKIAILFSGGLDCTLVARIVHDLLPKEEDVDLLNVAFENPRVLNAVKAGNDMPFAPYAYCPDRATGVSSHAELQRVCPGRTWRLVSIDIPYTETVAHRPLITTLLHPHNTEMDLSIACALYFAARGRGTVQPGPSEDTASYTTSARVLLSGLGADELFAGYTRHATAFSRKGFQGLSDELELDYLRLGKRNLGRDDRVISHWGREVRYPYLDEDFLRWTLRLPLWEKCGFGQPSPSASTPAEETGDPSLEPSKRILRLLAWKLGLRSAATMKKRAIQFGARTAKMEAGRIKGTRILS